MPLPADIVNPTLDGLTIIVAAFFFYCLAKPELVKNRSQYWMTFACLLGITLCYTLRLMLYNSSAGQVITGIVIGLLQAFGMVLTVLYVGGLSVRDVAGGMKDAMEDLRAGAGAKKDAIVPLTQEKLKPRDEPVAPKMISPEPKVQPPPPDAPLPRVVIELPKKEEGSGAIPLE